MDQTAVRLRHELKYSIDRGACALLREPLGAVMRSDAGGYEVRSLYFDDMYGSAYSDKSAGLLRREKFRLRIYDGDDGCIKLERKAKVGALCHKESERLSRARTSRCRRVSCPRRIRRACGGRCGRRRARGCSGRR